MTSVLVVQSDGRMSGRGNVFFDDASATQAALEKSGMDLGGRSINVSFGASSITSDHSLGLV